MKVGKTESYAIQDNAPNEGRVAVSIFNVGHHLRMMAESTYSRPIEAVVRETIANGVDAAQGKTAIEITVPSLLDPNFKVRDYGVGLSKEFFTDGYAKVGFSTKRDSNDEIGGFGQGRFAAFAYAGCDQFYVRGYKDGKTFLGSVYRTDDFEIFVQVESSGETTEPNGVEVIIPVLTADHGAFSNAVKIFTEFLKPAPVCPVKAIKRPVLFKGKAGNWCISAFAQADFSYEGYPIRAIMGGIPYNLDLDQVFGRYATSERLGISVGDFVFPIGALSVPASREELRYDDVTKYQIQNLFKEIKTEIEAEIASRQKHFTTDWEKWTDKSVASYLAALGQTTRKFFKTKELGHVQLLHSFRRFRKFSGRSNKVNDSLEVNVNHHYLVYQVDDEKAWRYKVSLDAMTKIAAIDAANPPPINFRHGDTKAVGYIICVGNDDTVKALGSPPVVKTSNLPRPPKQSRAVVATGTTPKVARVPHCFSLVKEALSSHPKWARNSTTDFTTPDWIWIPFKLSRPTEEYEPLTNYFELYGKQWSYGDKVVGVPEVDWPLARKAGWLTLLERLDSLVTKDILRGHKIKQASVSVNSYPRHDNEVCEEITWLVEKGFSLPRKFASLQRDIVLFTKSNTELDLMEKFATPLRNLPPDPSLNLTPQLKQFKLDHLLFYITCVERTFSREDQRGTSLPLLAAAKKAL